MTAGGALLRWNSTGSTIAGRSDGTAGGGSNQLQCPYALAFDTNYSLHITDAWNNRIQKYAIRVNYGTTVAGLSNGTAGVAANALYFPVGIVLDPVGNMYLTDRSNHRLMYWPRGAAAGLTLAGTTGVAGSTNSQFNTPSDLTRNHTTGTIFIADTFNHRIMRYPVNATSGTVVAGGHGAGTASNQLSSPYSFAFDPSSNSLLISNYGAHTIVRWSLNASTWTLIAGTPGSAGATSTLLRSPLSVVLDRYGNMYVADSDNHRIQFFLAGQSNATTIAGVAASSGISANQFNYPYWAIVDDQLNLFVADCFNNRVQRFQRL